MAGLWAGLRAGTTIRRPRLASGSVWESSLDRSRGFENEDEWRRRGEVMTEPNVGAGLVERGGLRKLGAHDQLGDAPTFAEDKEAEGERVSSDGDDSSYSVRLIDAISCSRSSSF